MTFLKQRLELPSSPLRKAKGEDAALSYEDLIRYDRAQCCSYSTEVTSCLGFCLNPLPYLSISPVLASGLL